MFYVTGEVRRNSSGAQVFSIEDSELSYQAYILDLDGTVYLGDRLLPGAAEAIETLRGRGARTVFLTNKPIHPRAFYAQKLTKLGISTDSEEVINSSWVAARYLGEQMPGARVFVMGEKALLEELLAAGLQEAQNPSQTDLVLISLDRGLTYDKLHFAYTAATAGAKVLATNPDLICPMPDDVIIDAGATIAAIEALLRRPIDGVTGKPSPVMIETVLKFLGVPPKDCLVVGDRLETDIAMGRSAGMATALVLTGVTDAEALAESHLKPDFVLESLASLPDLGAGSKG